MLRSWNSAAVFGVYNRTMPKAKAILRWSSVVVIVMLAFGVLGSAAMFASAKWYQYRVTQLAERIKDLSIGESTFDDLQKLEKDYRGSIEGQKNGCTQDECGLLIVLKNTSFPAFYDHPMMWRLGIRPTYAAANLRLKNGTLRYASFFISTRTQYGHWLEASFHASHELTMFDRCSQQYLGRNSTYAVKGAHLTNGAGGGQTIRAAFGSKASAAERSKATDLKLSCITSIPSCRWTTDLMPRAHENMTFDPDGDTTFTKECEAYARQLEVGDGPWKVDSAFSPDLSSVEIWEPNRSK
jgi:hypothetical protein